jgi:protease II
VLAPTKELQDTLYAEIVGRIKEDDSTAPVFDDGYWYYTRYETGKQYPIKARRKGTLEAAEEIIIDGNERATGHEFYSLGGLSISDDGALAAFSEDTVGRRQYTLRIKDLATGEVRDDRVDNITGQVMWTADNRTVVYVEKDPVTLRGYRVKAHVVGTAASSDRLLYQEDDETFYTGIWRSKSNEYLFVTLWSTITSEVQYTRADDPELTFQSGDPAPARPRVLGRSPGRLVRHPHQRRRQELQADRGPDRAGRRPLDLARAHAALGRGVHPRLRGLSRLFGRVRALRGAAAHPHPPLGR